MTSGPPRFAMVAGEASGDLLGGALLASLRARWPQLAAEGIGGPRMIEHGFVSWWPYDKLSVRGYFEVLGHFREILAIRNRLVERLLADKPDAFIGVDAPDFNLGVETRLKAAGVKTIHFVSPSIWAWRGNRIAGIGRATDLVLCIFPFEPEIYARRSINAVYVGHPLASAIPLEVPRAAARAALGVGAGETLVALLPGSRGSEIRYIAPRLFGAAAEMSRARPGLRFGAIRRDRWIESRSGRVPPTRRSTPAGRAASKGRECRAPSGRRDAPPARIGSAPARRRSSGSGDPTGRADRARRSPAQA